MSDAATANVLAGIRENIKHKTTKTATVLFKLVNALFITWSLLLE
jgi:hypothetical protein